MVDLFKDAPEDWIKSDNIEDAHPGVIDWLKNKAAAFGDALNPYPLVAFKDAEGNEFDHQGRLIDQTSRYYSAPEERHMRPISELPGAVASSIEGLYTPNNEAAADEGK